jgi:TonB family protein
VFGTLIESRREARRNQLVGIGLLSLLVHTALISGLVYATLRAGQTGGTVPMEGPVTYIVTPQKQPNQPPPRVDVRPWGFRTVVAPPDIPIRIPPEDLSVRLDPEDYRGLGVEGGSATWITPTGGDVFSVDLVQETPEMLSHPPLAYPEMLQQAGIEGSVIVQAIVDTTGRIEANSIRIVESPNPGFDEAAKNLLLGSRYRPARVYGRAVRVLIQQPIAFTIRRNR